MSVDATASEPMLVTTDVIGGYGSVQILNGVSLNVGRGQIVALLGGNGTGKSTMLKALSGLIKPWSGTIMFDGERIDGLRPDKIVRRGLVQVTQGKEAYPAMTVEENLLLGAHTRPARAARARGLDRAYEYFPILKERRRQLTGTLSGGQLQMLCIGRGLMSEPKMMLLDEPSAALAPQVVLEIFRTIGRICREGMTLLMVEQNVRMALLLAEYGYVIKDGVIHLEGLAETMINDDAVRLSYLGGTVADRDAKMSL
jgi:branched-chain amino acid transport system ATP-binding protein